MGWGEAILAWFRAYSEALNDRKVQGLTDKEFRVWHNCLYLACSINSRDGNIGSLEDVCFAIRETPETVSSAFHSLTERMMIEKKNETFHIVAWKKRQYKSDTSTNRVREYRKRFRNGHETAPDTDTDIKKKIEKKEKTETEVRVDPRCPDVEDALSIYNDEELSLFAISFPLVHDWEGIVEDVLHWCDTKGIERISERKNAVWKSLQKKQGERELVKSIGVVGAKASPELIKKVAERMSPRVRK